MAQGKLNSLGQFDSIAALSKQNAGFRYIS